MRTLERDLSFANMVAGVVNTTLYVKFGWLPNLAVGLVCLSVGFYMFIKTKREGKKNE